MRDVVSREIAVCPAMRVDAMSVMDVVNPGPTLIRVDAPAGDENGSETSAPVIAHLTFIPRPGSDVRQ